MKKTILTFIFGTVLFLSGFAQIGSTNDKCVSCKNNTISNVSSALGVGNTATGSSSFASGTENSSTGIYSTTLGKGNAASGEYSFAGGEGSSATQKWGFAYGQGAKSNGFRSFAQGMDVWASGGNSVAIGRFLKTMTSDAMVIGTGFGNEAESEYLKNSISGSLMIGFNSDIPTFVVRSASGMGTTGNVGIGTSQPSEKLEVNGTFKVNNWSYMNTIDLGNSDIKNIDELKGNGGLKFQGETQSTTTQMTLTAEGNLGIGTTSPNEKLEVDGNILQTAGFNVATSQIKAPDANGLSLTDQNGNGIFVDDGGNVGIGTVPDNAQLQVEGTIKGSLFEGDGSALTNVGDDMGNHTATQNIKLNQHWLSGNGNNQGIFIDNQGKVGIGTSSTNERLRIYTNTLTGLRVQTHQTEAWGYGIISDILNDDTKAYAVKNNGTDRFIVYGNGRTIIGNADYPYNGTLLTVIGKIKAREIRVTADAGADFVFDEGYKLPRLDDIEDYIATNKHLPDIPSAKQIQEDGLDLGDMQIKLLQKIEELTLYVIDLKKENEEIKKQLKNN
ncbi:MAG: hypothetical protein GXO89_06600 [Chlorobi bacterium]|nr:hypothetical protein [Chlorobiota bacterium]